MMARTPLLEVRGLSKIYGSRLVLDNVDLTIQPGDKVAVTGANGSGKSTLLRSIVGLAQHQGMVLVDGIPGEKARRRIGFLPQSVSLPPWATVAEVMEFFARLRGVDPHEHGLGEQFLPDPSQLIRALSGGQQQRVALAIAFLGHPSLLLLDEPAASLDEEGRLALLAAIDVAVGAGGSVLVAAPTGTESGVEVDRALTLRSGRFATDQVRGIPNRGSLMAPKLGM